MSILAQSPQTTAPPGGDPAPGDRYRYGWRQLSRTRPDGTSYLESIPLTLDDVLHPQLGDHVVEAPLHDVLRDDLADVARARTAPDPQALVVANCGVYWDVADGEHHAPDLSVIFGVRDRERLILLDQSYSVRQHGARPRLIVEIVSPHLRHNDVVTKFADYHRHEIPLYVIVDRERVGGPWTIIGYQYTPRGYLKLPNDERGRLWIECLGIWLGAEGQRVLCYDGKTDQPIGDYVQLTEALEQAGARTETERARAEAETARADANHARADAESARADAAQARADAEAKARELAEGRLRQLETELARRSGADAPTPKD